MSRKIDFDGRAWDAHPQDHWLDWAGHTHFPDYLRIVFVAYGRHKANGHANLDRGELAHYLVRKDGTLPDRRVVHDGIRRAVGFGYLMPESKALCLVVGSHSTQGGRGLPDERCRRDHTKRQANDRSKSGRFASNDRDQHCRSGANDRDQYGRSTLTPSLSSTAAPSGAGPTHDPEGAA